MQTNNGTPESDKKSVQRSASYPYFTIEDSIDFVTKMKVAFQTVRFSREDASKIVDKVDVSRDVASAVQYGLLEKLVGEGYKVTQTALYIINPFSEEEKADNIVECFKKPKLYNDLIEKYGNQVVPPDSQFQVILNRFHNITESAVLHVSKVFIQNAIFAGLLDKSRVLSSSKPVNESYSTDTTTESQEQGSPNLHQENAIPSEKIPHTAANESEKKQQMLLEEINGKVEIQIRLSEKKIARLVYPDSINEKDIKILKLQLEQIALTLDIVNE